MSIHSRNDDVILQFGLKKPAFRIVVNSPTTHGSIGLSTGLDPAMTLGCGGYGGNITSDNISPRHLLNIKRMAYEVNRPLSSPQPEPRLATPPRRRPTAAEGAARPRTPGLAAGPLARRIDQFLVSRGFSAGTAPEVPVSGDRRPRQHRRPPRPSQRHRPHRRNRSQSRSISCAKTTSGRRCGRAESWSSASGPSSRRRRAISASSTGCSCRPNGRAELRQSFPLPVERLGLWLTDGSRMVS